MAPVPPGSPNRSDPLGAAGLQGRAHPDARPGFKGLIPCLHTIDTTPCRGPRAPRTYPVPRAHRLRGPDRPRYHQTRPLPGQRTRHPAARLAPSLGRGRCALGPHLPRGLRGGGQQPGPHHSLFDPQRRTRPALRSLLPAGRRSLRPIASARPAPVCGRKPPPPGRLRHPRLQPQLRIGRHQHPGDAGSGRHSPQSSRAGRPAPGRPGGAAPDLCRRTDRHQQPGALRCLL